MTSPSVDQNFFTCVECGEKMMWVCNESLPCPSGSDANGCGKCIFCHDGNAKFSIDDVNTWPMSFTISAMTYVDELLKMELWRVVSFWDFIANRALDSEIMIRAEKHLVDNLFDGLMVIHQHERETGTKLPLEKRLEKLRVVAATRDLSGDELGEKLFGGLKDGDPDSSS